jgi:hypothetical protein
MNKTITSSTSKAPKKDGFLEMIKKILGSAPKKTTAPGKLSGRLSLPLLPPMDMAPMTPKKKTTVVQVKKTVSGKPSLLPLMAPMTPMTPKKKTTKVVQVKKTVSGKPGPKKTTKVQEVVEKKVSKSSGASSGSAKKMKGGCSSMYKGKGAGCTKGKIGGNFGYFF